MMKKQTFKKWLEESMRREASEHGEILSLAEQRTNPFPIKRIHVFSTPNDASEFCEKWIKPDKENLWQPKK